ncbi:MAG TPA: amidohydrolase family protein [Ohtaekwangia sp.]|nr:amidohydrolase family protein [Ohtaekwangia sp.]
MEPGVLRKFTLLLFIILSAAGYAQEPSLYVVNNVTVIPMSQEGTLVHQTVVIRDGLIVSMGSAGRVKIPEGAAVIDGTGKFLIPGLFDMHAHFFYEQGPNVNTCEEELKIMLANGLTTTRIICGDPAYLQARNMVRTGQWSGPELYVTSPQFVGKWPWSGKVFAAICTTPEEATTAVRRFKEEGYDEIKITFMVTRDVYDAIIAAARATGMKVTGHVGPLVKLPRALEARQQIEHMDEFIDMLLPDTTHNHGQSVSDMNIWREKAWATVDHLDESRIPALVQRVKQAAIYVTPTNFFFFSSFGEGMTEEQIRSRPDYAFIPEAIKGERWSIRSRYWQKAPSPERRKKYVHLRKKMTYELWKGGVKLMAGSDSPEWFLVQGFSIHEELETFVKAGLTPWAALQTATVNPAAYLGISGRTGSVGPGKEADLILLDKNPMEDIRNTRAIRGVFVNGKFFDREQLDDLLAAARVIGR